jgi:hypothetical protein
LKGSHAGTSNIGLNACSQWPASVGATCAPDTFIDPKSIAASAAAAHLSFGSAASAAAAAAEGYDTVGRRKLTQWNPS